ncbi:MAG: MarR family winged helix-turn-helix transcriptional regulator [Faecousia sp.]
MEKERTQSPEEVLGELLDKCGHFFAHRIGASRRGRGNLMTLVARKPGITQKELAEALGIQPASVSEVLYKLERKGFVTREKAEQDRRSIRVTLTEEGQQHLNQPEPDLSAAFQALSSEEKAQLARLLGKLLQDWQQRYPAERGDHHSRG